MDALGSNGKDFEPELYLQAANMNVCSVDCLLCIQPLIGYMYNAYTVPCILYHVYCTMNFLTSCFEGVGYASGSTCGL